MEDASGPVVAVLAPGAWINRAKAALEFTVENAAHGYGVAAEQTGVTYTINNGDPIPAEPAIVSQARGKVQYRHAFAETFSHGDIVRYTISARDLAEPFNPSAPFEGEFSVDLVGPVANGFLPSAEIILVSDNTFSFDAADAGSGIASVEAVLTRAGSAARVGETSGSEARRYSFISQPLQTSTSYLLRVVALDVAGNRAITERRYLVAAQIGEGISPDTIAPVISISPASGSTVTGRAAQVSIADSGTGVNAASVVVSLNGKVLRPRSVGGSRAFQSNATYNYELPGDTPNGQHTLTAAASDNQGNLASASSTFTLQQPYPPAPLPTGVELPAGAVAQDGDYPGSVYWNFKAEDIKGVSKPRMSPQVANADVIV